MRLTLILPIFMLCTAAFVFTLIWKNELEQGKPDQAQSTTYSRRATAWAPSPTVCLSATCLGTYRVTVYAKGKHKDGTPFRGKYHTAASRVAAKRSWLYLQAAGGAATMVYVNDTFGTVRHHGKTLSKPTVASLVVSRVLSAVDLAQCAADDLGIEGDADCVVWKLENPILGGVE